MRNVVGSPVEGEDFFGRKLIVKQLQALLGTDDVLLLGPRRIGKTSTCRAVIAGLKREGWRALEINVAACSDEQGFLHKLLEGVRPEMTSTAAQLLEKLSHGAEALARRIKSVKIAGGVTVDLGAGTNEDWTAVGSDLLKLLVEAEGHWLIYVDELPIFLFNMIRNDAASGVQRVRRFLDWFRNDVRATPGMSNIRWLISGSVGLDTLVQEHQMADTINSLNHQGLKAFDETMALEMLQCLAHSYKVSLDDSELQKVVAAVQWPQPYYLQKIFANLRAHLPLASGVSLDKAIESAMQQLISPGEDNDFHHWEQRLSMQLSPTDAAHAWALLSLSAQDPQGVSPEWLWGEFQGRLPHLAEAEAKRVFVRLRDILLRDAYWREDSSTGRRRYRFYLEPLRRWWLRRDAL